MRVKKLFAARVCLSRGVVHEAALLVVAVCDVAQLDPEMLGLGARAVSLRSRARLL